MVLCLRWHIYPYLEDWTPRDTQQILLYCEMKFLSEASGGPDGANLIWRGNWIVKNGNEVDYMNSWILLAKNMLCSKLHCPKAFNLIPFSCKIVGAGRVQGLRFQEQVFEFGGQVSRERVLYWQPAGPNPLYHRDDLVTGLAPRDFEFPFPGSLTSTFLKWGGPWELYRSLQFPIQEQLLSRNVERFRGGLVFKAHRLLHHSTPGSRVIKKKKKDLEVGGAPSSRRVRRTY